MGFGLAWNYLGSQEMCDVSLKFSYVVLCYLTQKVILVIHYGGTAFGYYLCDLPTRNGCQVDFGVSIPISGASICMVAQKCYFWLKNLVLGLRNYELKVNLIYFKKC